MSARFPATLATRQAAITAKRNPPMPGNGLMASMLISNG
jgi:hypothetical protein